MKYKIGDTFKLFDNHGYYIIYEVIPSDKELDGWYRVNHICKYIQIHENSKSFTRKTFENKISNQQIEFVGNSFYER